MPGRSITRITIGVATGALAWTATEYGAHRWALHGPFGTGRWKWLPLGGLHRAHHRVPEHTSLLARGAGHVAIAGVAAVAASSMATIVPAAFARSAAAAWSTGYSTYEISHWNFHHRPARTTLGRHLRDRHHRHHFGSPASNLGVTMSFWDHLCGTEASARPGAPAQPDE